MIFLQLNTLLNLAKDIQIMKFKIIMMSFIEKLIKNKI